MSARPLVGLVASAALHGAIAIVAVLLVARSDSLPPLFIDLTVDTAEREAPLPARVASPVAPRARGDTRAREPSRAGARPSRPEAVTPAPPSAPVAAAPTPVPLEEARPPAPESPPSPPPAPVAVERPPDPPAHEALPPVTWPVPSLAGTEARSASQAADAGSSAGVGDARSPTAATPSTPNPDGGLARVGDGRATSDGVGGGRQGQQMARATPGGAIGGPGAEYGPWLRGLRERIQASLRYPATARRRGISGTVTLELTIQSSGAIQDVRVVESSSHGVLDTAAVEAVRGLPAQPMPGDLEHRPLRVRLPVVFQLR